MFVEAVAGGGAAVPIPRVVKSGCFRALSPNPTSVRQGTAGGQLPLSLTFGSHEAKAKGATGHEGLLKLKFLATIKH